MKTETWLCHIGQCLGYSLRRISHLKKSLTEFSLELFFTFDLPVNICSSHIHKNLIYRVNFISVLPLIS